MKEDKKTWVRFVPNDHYKVEPCYFDNGRVTRYRFTVEFEVEAGWEMSQALKYFERRSSLEGYFYE